MLSGRVDADPADNDRNVPEAIDPSRSYAPPIDVKMVNGVAATAIRSEGQYPTIKARAVFSSTALFLWGHGRCGDASALSWRHYLG